MGGAYLAQRQHLPASYTSTVAEGDHKTDSRVFSNFLEFKVGYGEPLNTSWSLVRNWQAGRYNAYCIVNTPPPHTHTHAHTRTHTHTHMYTNTHPCRFVPPLTTAVSTTMMCTARTC
jgi:hypothetical protein